MMEDLNWHLYNQRINAIDRALSAIRKARTIGIFSLEFDHAEEMMRLARIQTVIDFRNREAVAQEKKS